MKFSKPLIVGQRIEVKTTVKDSAGAAFDPISSLFEFEDPTGAFVDKDEAPAHPSVGVFGTQMTPMLAGTWWCRYEGKDGSGNVVAADEGPFEVEATHFPPS
jgi:hypothetical protein